MNEVYLFRLEADPPAYLWTGNGDIDVPGDALVGSAVTRYRGIGTLTGLPDLPLLINGTADRADFTLSGVDPIAVRYADEDKLTIRDAVIRIGTLVLDDKLQIAGVVDWEWEGRADTISIGSEGQEDGSRSLTITISAGTAASGRSTSGVSFFTNADQRQRSPDDAFFSFIGGMTQSATRTFGVR